MKKFMVIVAIVAAMIGGFFAGKLDISWNHDWSFQRGIGQTEVRADYNDTDAEGKVYTQIIVWDKGFENYRVVDKFYLDKDKLYDLSEITGNREAEYVEKAMF